jgi:hypothetical protein
METKYMETSLQNIMEFWVKNYDLPEGLRIYDFQWFVNPYNNRVVFKITTTDTPDPLAR